MPKITLDEEYIYDGQWYGPGIIDVKDETAAKSLTAAQDRVRGSRNPSPVLKPNGLAAGVLPGADAPLNATTADDFLKQAEASSKLAADRAKEEAAAKKAATDAKAGK